MQTRRQLLQQAMVLPLAAGLSSARRASGVEVISEPDCLSEESARGFSLVPVRNGRIVVVCGAGAVAMSRAQELRRRAMGGEWVIWESSPNFLPFREDMRKVFGIQLGEPFNAGLYVHYGWPRQEMTRSFMHAIPVVCSDSEVIARHSGVPVAIKRRVGRGGIVFLGSMLGPNLHAEEPEARRIAARLLREFVTS